MQEPTTTPKIIAYLVPSDKMPDLNGWKIDSIAIDECVPLSEIELKALPDFHGKMDGGFIRTPYEFEKGFAMFSGKIKTAIPCKFLERRALVKAQRVEWKRIKTER